MFGLAVGLLCGVGEYLLLSRLTKAVLTGGNPLIYLLLKVALLAAALGSVYFIDKEQLIWAATGIAAPLVLTPFIRFVATRLRGTR